MKNNFDVLFDLGFKKRIDVKRIIAILNIEVVKDNMPPVENYMECVPDKKIRSLIYCIGGYVVGSPIDPKTLAGRYEKFLSDINGFSDHKSLYLDVS